MTLKMTVVENTDEDATTLSIEEIHFRTSSAAMAQAPIGLSEHTACKRYFFVEFPKGYCDERGFATRTSVCAILSGRLEIKTSDNEVCILTAGDTLALRDIAFEAPTRVITVLSDEPVRALIIQLE